jgi:micrococcal nuclease
VDGDTLYLNVDLGFHVSRVTNVRLARCNAPELREVGGLEAKGALARLVTEKKLILRSEKVDVYGRAIGEIVLPDGSNVTDRMIADGFARPATYSINFA